MLGLYLQEAAREHFPATAKAGWTQEDLDMFLSVIAESGVIAEALSAPALGLAKFDPVQQWPSNQGTAWVEETTFAEYMASDPKNFYRNYTTQNYKKWHEYTGEHNSKNADNPSTPESLTKGLRTPTPPALQVSPLLLTSTLPKPSLQCDTSSPIRPDLTNAAYSDPYVGCSPKLKDPVLSSFSIAHSNAFPDFLVGPIESYCQSFVTPWVHPNAHLACADDHGEVVSDPEVARAESPEKAPSLSPEDWLQVPLMTRLPTISITLLPTLTKTLDKLVPLTYAIRAYLQETRRHLRLKAEDPTYTYSPKTLGKVAKPGRSKKLKRKRRVFDYGGFRVPAFTMPAPRLQNNAVNQNIQHDNHKTLLVELHDQKQCIIERPRYVRGSLTLIKSMHANVRYDKNPYFGEKHPYQQEFTRVELHPVTGSAMMETRSGLCAYCEEISFFELKNLCYAQHMSHSHGIFTDDYLAPNPLYIGTYNVAKKPGPDRKTVPRRRSHECVVCPACFEIVEIKCWSLTLKDKPLLNYLRHFKDRHRVERRRELFFNHEW